LHVDRGELLVSTQGVDLAQNVSRWPRGQWRITAGCIRDTPEFGEDLPSEVQIGNVRRLDS